MRVCVVFVCLFACVRVCLVVRLFGCGFVCWRGCRFVACLFVRLCVFYNFVFACMRLCVFICLLACRVFASVVVIVFARSFCVCPWRVCWRVCKCVRFCLPCVGLHVFAFSCEVSFHACKLSYVLVFDGLCA